MAQNITISLEYHQFELDIIERNPQDGGHWYVHWWCYGMVGWSKTNVPPPRPNIWLGLSSKMSFLQSLKNLRLAKFAEISPREIHKNFFVREIRENKLPRNNWNLQSRKLTLAKFSFRENLYTRSFVPLRYPKTPPLFTVNLWREVTNRLMRNVSFSFFSFLLPCFFVPRYIL